MTTYQVPVWFNIQANTQEEAWSIAANAMMDAEKHDQLPEYIVEEPIATPEENA